MGEAAGEQAPLLLATEGMAGEHQRDAEAPAHQRAHVAGIGVVGVDPVRQPRTGGQGRHQGIGEFIEVGPELLLAQVAARAEGQAQDAGTWAERLVWFGIVGRDAPVRDAARHHLHLVHLRAGRQGTHQLQHIGGLAAGVGIAAELQIAAAEQAV